MQGWHSPDQKESEKSYLIRDLVASQFMNWPLCYLYPLTFTERPCWFRENPGLFKVLLCCKKRKCVRCLILGVFYSTHGWPLLLKNSFTPLPHPRFTTTAGRSACASHWWQRASHTSHILTSWWERTASMATTRLTCKKDVCTGVYVYVCSLS